MYITIRVVEKRHGYYFEKASEIILIGHVPHGNPGTPVVAPFTTKAQGVGHPWAISARVPCLTERRSTSLGHNALRSGRLRAVDGGFLQHRIQKSSPWTGLLRGGSMPCVLTSQQVWPSVGALKCQSHPPQVYVFCQAVSEHRSGGCASSFCFSSEPEPEPMGLP